MVASSDIHIDASQFLGISKEKADLILAFIEANGTKTNLEYNFEQTLAKTPEDKKEDADTAEFHQKQPLLDTAPTNLGGPSQQIHGCPDFQRRYSPYPKKSPGKVLFCQIGGGRLKEQPDTFSQPL